MPVIVARLRNAALNAMICTVDSFIVMPAKCSNKGSKAEVMQRATVHAIKVIISASPRNCAISDDRTAPSVFRIPTSADLFEKRAVERFMKLIQAISRMNMAMEASIYR